MAFGMAFGMAFTTILPEFLFRTANFHLSGALLFENDTGFL
jgi:hypothetical protein